MNQFKSLGLAALALAAMSIPASAGPISLTGNFTNDNDVVFVPFTIQNTVLVTFQTFGYGGGVNAAGQFIAPGGFEPMLQLFDSPSGAVHGGTMLPGSAPNPCGPQIPDPNRLNFCFDVFAQMVLNPGDYILALTQNDNTTAGINLSDGFIHDLEPNFAGGFVGTFGFQGTNQWALDITTTPEPGAALLVAPALLLIGFVRRRRTHVN